jgi:ABC-type phosphate/phosphonate transport system substrate-binding protein
MTSFVMNARMYAVTPEVEAAWRRLLEAVTEEAGLAFDYLPYPAPAPLEDLWRRGDLGCVFMCGYPIALKLADVIPIAAPIPSLAWAGGEARYRSDLIVRKDAPFARLEDSFAGHAGWTIEHSHSGFNAFRHHLLPYRRPERPKLYRAVTGSLVTARNILDAVRDGRIDIGPLDAYWHALIARHRPDLVADIRVLESTACAPIPAFVAAPALGADAIERLRAAFRAAPKRGWFAPLAQRLLLSGFAPLTQASFAETLRQDAAAKEAGYSAPG